jgi:hypothetical protein
MRRSFGGGAQSGAALNRENTVSLYRPKVLFSKSVLETLLKKQFALFATARNSLSQESGASQNAL